MAIVEIKLPRELREPSAEIVSFIEEATKQQEDFYTAGLGIRYPKYVPSDPRVVCSAISFLIEENHLQGMTFCEWGCGFAIASGIASMQGMKAYGIEIEDELVDRALHLKKTMNLSVEILQTDYLPYGFDEVEEIGGKELIAPLEDEVMPEYEGLDPAEVDLFFVYPWPDQEEMMQDLFEAVSSDGAVLLIYQGEGEISAFLND